MKTCNFFVDLGTLNDFTRKIHWGDRPFNDLHFFVYRQYNMIDINYIVIRQYNLQ